MMASALVAFASSRLRPWWKTEPIPLEPLRLKLGSSSGVRKSRISQISGRTGLPVHIEHRRHKTILLVNIEALLVARRHTDTNDKETLLPGGMRRLSMMMRAPLQARISVSRAAASLNMRGSNDTSTSSPRSVWRGPPTKSSVKKSPGTMWYRSTSCSALTFLGLNNVYRRSGLAFKAALLGARRVKGPGRRTVMNETVG